MTIRSEPIGGAMNLKDLFPNASNAFLQRNLELGDTGEVTELERRLGDAALVPAEVKVPDSGRFLVCVTSYRKRLLDEDNLCEKYHVDCCRYAGLLPSDNPTQTKIEVRQVKVGEKDQEFTRVQIYRIEGSVLK
jgi:hypothetical protein